MARRYTVSHSAQDRYIALRSGATGATGQQAALGRSGTQFAEQYFAAGRGGGLAVTPTASDGSPAFERPANPIPWTSALLGLRSLGTGIDRAARLLRAPAGRTWPFAGSHATEAQWAAQARSSAFRHASIRSASDLEAREAATAASSGRGPDGLAASAQRGLGITGLIGPARVRAPETTQDRDRRIVLEFKLGPQATDEILDALAGQVYRHLADFLTTQYA